MKTKLASHLLRDALVISFGAMMLCASARGAIRTVTTDSDNNVAGELRYEISHAAANDTIVFDPTYFSTPRTILLDYSLYYVPLGIVTNLTIVGPGPANLTISAQGTNRVFAIYGGVVNISGLTITGGSAPSEGGVPPFYIPSYAHGGGIYSSHATLTLSNCWVVGNQAAEGIYQVAASGGGIYSELGLLTVVDCIISNNVAHADNSLAGYKAAGGGIYISPPSASGVLPLKMLRSTVSGNVALGSAAAGGGLFVALGTPPLISTITNSTFSGNTAQSTATTGTDMGLGGGLNATNVMLMNCTVVNNLVAIVGSRAPTLGPGGGLSGAQLSLKNTIVAGNQARSYYDVFGNLFSAGHNLIGLTNGVSAFTAPGDIAGTLLSPIDPQLDPLQDNGGLTPTHALRAGSPAIDKGDNTGAPFTDQRGVTRPYNSVVDIGAFEYNGGAPSPLVIDCAPDVNTWTLGCATTVTLAIPGQLPKPTVSGGSGPTTLKVRFEGDTSDHLVPPSLTFSIGVTNLVWTATDGDDTQSCTQQVAVVAGTNQPPGISVLSPALAVIPTNSATSATLLVSDPETANPALLNVASSSDGLVSLMSSEPDGAGQYLLTITAGDQTGTAMITNIVTDSCGDSSNIVFSVQVSKPPVFSPISDQTIPKGNIVTSTVPFHVDSPGALTFGAKIVLPPPVFLPGLGYATMFVLSNSFAAAGADETFSLVLGIPVALLSDPDFFPTNVNVTIFATNDAPLSASSSFTITILGASDTDGIDDTVEDAAPNSGDANHDGIPDKLQSNVASFPGTNISYVTISVADPLQLEYVHVLNPPGTPPGEFPYGLIEFSLKQLPAPGSSVTVTQIFDGGLPAGTTFYKYGSQSFGALDDYYPFIYAGPGTSGAEIVGNTIILHLTDGSLGDDDWTTNGVIIDPGGPAIVTVPSPQLTFTLLSDQQAQISWPVADGGAVLQSRTNLDVLIPWEDVTNTVVTNLDIMSVTIDLDVSQRFYRLGPPSP